MNLMRLENETVNEYISRLGLSREIEGLTWKDISISILNEFGVDISEEAVRKRYHRNLQNVHPVTTETIQTKIYDTNYVNNIRTERQQLSAMYRVFSREDTIRQIAKEAVKALSISNPFKHRQNTQIKYDSKTKTGILLIGDWHYGINIDSTFNRFNPDIAVDRVWELVNKVIDCGEKNGISQLYVINLGDMIAGNIHLPLRINSQMDVITQIMRVSELIANAVDVLSTKFHIDYYSTFDNHSRIDPNKKESIQLESLSRITPWFLLERLANNKNVIIHENEFYAKDMVSFCTYPDGYNVIAVHGDKDTPKTIVDRLTAFTGDHQDLICTAHYHHFSCDEQNRTIVISNGALMGTDDYAMDLRLDSEPSQTLIIQSPQNVCECIYKINLTK